MIEKGNKVADRMDGGLASGRAAAKQAREQAQSSGAEMSAKKTSRSKKSDMDEQNSEKLAKQSAIEEMITRAKKSRVEAEEGDAEPTGKRQRRQGARLRSKAEQELFEALKTGGGSA